MLASDGAGLNGCYASHILLHAGTHVAKIPPNVPDVVASPLNCALATMVNAVDGIVDCERLSHWKRAALVQVW